MRIMSGYNEFYFCYETHKNDTFHLIELFCLSFINNELDQKNKEL